MEREQFQELIEGLYALGEGYSAHFEELRDEIHGLGPRAMEYVLEAALDERSAFMLDLLVTVLADVGYPPAMEHFVNWLDHDDGEVRFTAASALDELAEGRFGVQGMIEGGWVQQEQVLEVVPLIKAWWDREGKHEIMPEYKWRAMQAAKPKYTEWEKLYNFIELNPTWQVIGNGKFIRPEGDLPRNEGIHIVGGTVQVRGEKKPRFAAIELDSRLAKVYKVLVKVDGWWIEVTDRVDRIEPNHTFDQPQ